MSNSATTTRRRINIEQQARQTSCGDRGGKHEIPLYGPLSPNHEKLSTQNPDPGPRGMLFDEPGTQTLSSRLASHKEIQHEAKHLSIWLGLTGCYLMSSDGCSLWVPRHARRCRCQGYLQQQRPRKRKDGSRRQRICIACVGLGLIAGAGPWGRLWGD